jgi:UDP-N-acetylmuramoyl-tripeptide--D-alanyl-D-alanine ligase
MIALTLTEIAGLVDGVVHGDGDGDVLVTAPATVDSRVVEPGGLFVAVVGEHVDGHDFVADAMAMGAAGVLASQPVPAPCVVVDDVIDALGRLAHAVLDRIDPIVIAITGSQGKTGVKDIVARVLAESGPTVAAAGSFNNDLGVPLTVLRADERTRYLVLEMGARGIGHIAKLCAIAEPDIGVVLNVGSAHAGEFGSREATAQAKGEMVEALAPEGVAVLNADDPLTAPMATRTAARILTFGTTGNVELGDLRLDAAGEPSFTLSHAGETVTTHVPQLGEHHALNAAAATAICLAAGVELATIGIRLTGASAQSPMRMQQTTRSDGVLVVNDAYNANPESMAAALRAVSHLRTSGRRIVAVLGEMRELGEGSEQSHLDVGRLAAELGFDLVVAVDAPAAAVAEGAGEHGVFASDPDEAARIVSAWLTPGDVVLVKASRGARLERVTAALGA